MCPPLGGARRDSLLCAEITENRAPNQFNNTPLADQRFRVRLAPSSLSIKAIA